MKAIKIFSYIMVGSLLLSSCTDELLNKTNPNVPTTGSYYTTPEEGEEAVVAAYSGLQFMGAFNRYRNYTYSTRAQESAFTDKQSGLQEVTGLDNFTVTSNTQAVEETWRDPYMGIWKANMAIENLQGISFEDEDQKNRLLGESYFLRALFHFHLVRNFGEAIPYYDASPVTESDFFPANAEEGVIFSLIESDLIKAIDYLPTVETYRGTQDIGRASSGAAAGLLGKVYLAQHKYQLAADAFSQVLDGTYGAYRLVERFRDNHDGNNENNEESLFEIQYQLTIGDVWNIIYENESASEAQIIEQGQTMVDGTGGMWWNMKPTDESIAEFESSDPRYYKTFWCPGGDDYYVLDLTADSLVPTAYENYIDGDRIGEFGWRKWGRDYETGSWESDVNVRILRLADVYLMYAECLLEGATGKAGGTAAEYINKVRDRARNIPDAGKYALTGTLPTVEALIASAPVINGVTINTMEAALRHERQVELMNEAVRWDDILRWGIEDEVLPSNYKKVLPIPQKDLDANPNLSPNEAN